MLGWLIGLTVWAALLQAGQVPGNRPPVTGKIDPYKPLAVYPGSWASLSETSAEGDEKPEPIGIDTDCARTGRVYVCEQRVNGKAALLAFLPVITTESEITYRLITVDLDADASEVSELHIRGNHREYEWHAKDGLNWRTDEDFCGSDEEHFAIYFSTDGKSWKKAFAGERYRINNRLPSC